jgi:hypothetical protein
MTMPDTIQPKQPKRVLKSYTGNLKIRLNSLDLAYSDFHQLGLLKTHLNGRHFTNDEVDMEMREWLRQQSKYLYAAGFDTLVK